MRHATRTAVIYAFFRAVESNRPASDRLFYDPYAKLFLPPILRMWVWFSRYRLGRWFVPWYVELRWPGSITSVVARTKLIDDFTVDAIKDHKVYQVVILGAGYETRAHRLANEQVQFVEVDRPVTQMYKRHLLIRKGIIPTPPIDYVPMDFKTQDPEQTIPRILKQRHYKTLIIWEGAVNNLTASIGNTMFRYFQQFPSGTRFIFNYVDKKILDDPRSFSGANSVVKMLRKMKEQWDTGLTPETLEAFLATYNMKLLWEGNATKYRKLYAGGSRDHRRMRGYEFLHVAVAELK
jgi:methyltransferase (TIGR00027 family)